MDNNNEKEKTKMNIKKIKRFFFKRRLIKLLKLIKK